MEPLIVAGITLLCLVGSAIADPRRTAAALKAAGRRLLALLPSLLTALGLVSLVLAFVSHDLIVRYLGGDDLLGAAVAAGALGSISLMPGFVAFPLAGILVEQGVARSVVAAFTTTLMMVGVVTFPVERRYFGVAVSVVRNLLSLLVAAAIALAIGIAYGELG